MTIQWTLVATFLYCELTFISLLLLPFISPTVWQYLFQSRLCKAIACKADIYFTVFIAVLSLLFLDSIREMHKYSSGLTDHERSNLDSEIQLNMKLFRSQRNYYIAGFAVFLWLVIRRLIILISSQATLLAENETIMRHAQNATETAQKLLRQKEEWEKTDTEENIRNFNKEINFLQSKLLKTEAELETSRNDLCVVLSDALAVSKEYEQLQEKIRSTD